MNWEISLREAETHAIKLDTEWIKRLRNAWLHPVSEQFSLQGKPLALSEQPRRSTVLPKQTNRRCSRLSVAQSKVLAKIETDAEKPSDDQSIKANDYSHQKFVDWRLFLNNNNLSQFQLYILPVRV